MFLRAMTITVSAAHVNAIQLPTLHYTTPQLRMVYTTKTAPENKSNVHVTATVLENVSLGSGCVIGPNAVIGPDVNLEANAHVEANAVVGPAVNVGLNSKIGAGSSVMHCDVGRDSVMWPGVRVGQDGFGFDIGVLSGGRHRKRPQLMRVVIGNEVELGANCTVDRGSWRDTHIGNGTKMDNQVHIAHNVHIGERCLFAGQSGVAGSTTLGDGVMIGGQAGIAQHLDIGQGAQIMAKSMVIHNVVAGAKVGGCPAVSAVQFHRATILARRTASSIRTNNKDNNTNNDT